jgi:hypothetical protein
MLIGRNALRIGLLRIKKKTGLNIAFHLLFRHQSNTAEAFNKILESIDSSSLVNVITSFDEHATALLKKFELARKMMCSEYSLKKDNFEWFLIDTGKNIVPEITPVYGNYNFD